MANKRRRKKTTIVNKTRFSLFCLICILVLAFIFIKIFMPALNKNIAADQADQNLDQSFVESSAGDRGLNNHNKPSSQALASDEKKESESSSEDRTESKESEETEEDHPPGEYHDILESVAEPYVYFNQEDTRWGHETFGPVDPIWSHGCGPAVMASIITTLTDRQVNPKEMADWAYENGYHAPDNGSLHSLIPESAWAFGLNAEPMYYPSKDQVEQTLRDGKYIVMVSGHGVFSDADGHFIVLIDIDENGQVQISDSVEYGHVKMDWHIEDILAEASPVSSAGGPFWAIWADGGQGPQENPRPN